ncbi:nuclear transport factor 2 family protein [Paraconexibacter algicola]|uniref:DUF4440 domain-containing protein n=1 Tax=Paraconexibacter algicola TaxID=2133960 RepID=A0A2T4UHP6_9ACTN|nr:nuclear transport factor 2 family protein [Paraconexibacter algicola]PTL58748.1 DUF4440 domain-containing protein [Paraconexibacter algicola]
MSSAQEHVAVIDRLYAALAAGDGEAMAACYTPDAVFEDPAFGELRDGAAQDMWRMLTARASGVEVEVPERDADEQTGHARWIARYDFQGRPVVNEIRARYVFRDGLIADHRDSFDLHAWAAQAMGPLGKVLGHSPVLRLLVRRRTAGQLAAFRQGRMPLRAPAGRA